MAHATRKTQRSVSPPSANQPIDLLLANYRETRAEGTALARSGFTDVAVAFALVGAIIGGEALADNHGLLFLLPLLLLFLFLYAVQKLRVANLLTNYAVYLESELNRHFNSAIMVWNSRIARSSLSVATRGTWGNRILYAASAIMITTFGGASYWAYAANLTYLGSRPWLSIAYFTVCALGIIFSLNSLRTTLATINTMTPEDIRKLVEKTPL